MEVFLNELSNAAEKNEEDDIKSLSDTYFLPLYPNFIEDEDPIPMYAQKLLVMLIESNFVKISDILHLKTVSQCFEFLLGDLSCAMVNNVKLCINLASAPEMEGKTLSQLRVVRKIGNLLEFVIKKEMDDFLEPTLCLCKAFLLRCTGSYSKEPALLGSSAFGTTLMVDPHNCVKDIADFGCNTGAFLKMSGAKDAQVADVASECVVLLLKAAPREGTMGLLTNLHKLTCVLESWYHGLSRLQLLRLLHATGFACRQYLSQGMILSIASTEIAKLDSLVSDIRSSNMGGVSEVAMVVSAELQRLPRCI